MHSRELVGAGFFGEGSRKAALVLSTSWGGKAQIVSFRGGVGSDLLAFFGGWLGAIEEKMTKVMLLVTPACCR